MAANHLQLVAGNAKGKSCQLELATHPCPSTIGGRGRKATTVGINSNNGRW
jgi:hypothetical protein